MKEIEASSLESNVSLASPRPPSTSESVGGISEVAETAHFPSNSHTYASRSSTMAPSTPLPQKGSPLQEDALNYPLDAYNLSFGSHMFKLPPRRAFTNQTSRVAHPPIASNYPRASWTNTVGKDSTKKASKYVTHPTLTKDATSSSRSSSSSGRLEKPEVTSARNAKRASSTTKSLLRPVNAQALMVSTSALVKQILLKAMQNHFKTFSPVIDEALLQHLEIRAAQLLAKISYRAADAVDAPLADVLQNLEMRLKGMDLATISYLRQLVKKLTSTGLQRVSTILQLLMELSTASFQSPANRVSSVSPSNASRSNSITSNRVDAAIKQSVDPYKSLSARSSEVTNGLERLKVQGGSETSAAEAIVPCARLYEAVINQFEFVSVSEATLLRDIIFALQGIDGQYVGYHSDLNCYLLHPMVKVSNSVRSMITHLCLSGGLYRSISQTLETSQKKYGGSLVREAFYQCISDQLVEYYKLIAILENDLNAASETEGSQLTLRRMAVWLEEPYRRMRLLALLVNEAAHLKGGALLSALFAHIRYGDAYERLLTEVIERSMLPLLNMIHSWMEEGELCDSHGEFFVVQNRDVSPYLFWLNQYALDIPLVPSFIKLDIAKKILLTGKSMNLIRKCYSQSDGLSEASVSLDTGAEMDANESKGIKASEVEPSVTPETAFVLPLVQNLEISVNQSAYHKNWRLVKLLISKYNLLHHFEGLKRFLLIGDGDFHKAFLENASEELSKNAAQIRRHNLVSIIHSSLQTGSLYAYHTDIVKRLYAETHSYSRGDNGWDIFYLDYHISPPVDVIFTPNVLQIYRNCFGLLWKLFRISHLLSHMWLRNISQMKRIRSFHALSQTLHECFLLRSQMNHFINNMHSYFMYEVIDTAWDTFQNALKRCSDLDALLSCHNAFLTNLQDGLFLSESNAAPVSSSAANREERYFVTPLLNKLFEIILNFITLSKTIWFSASRFTAVYRADVTIYENGAFSESTLTQLENTRNDYQIAMKSFLDVIGKKQQMSLFNVMEIDKAASLQALICRLNFNVFYQTHMKRLDSFVKP